MEILILVLMIISLFCFLIRYESNQNYLKKRVKRFYKLVNNLQKDYENNNLSKEMKNAGIPINLFHYQVLRVVLLSLFILMILISKIKGGEFSAIQILTTIILFLVTTPRKNILGKKTPFQMIIDVSLNNKRTKYNQELYMSISQLKTTFLIKKDKPPSSDFILEQVRKYTRETREIFNQMMNLWMIGQKELAVQYFENEIGTKEAQKLGQVFLKLDDLNPIEMKQQLEAYQEIYRTEKETKKLKENENKSNMLFMFVVATCFIVLMNFLVVVFFIDFVKDMQNIV